MKTDYKISNGDVVKLLAENYIRDHDKFLSDVEAREEFDKIAESLYEDLESDPMRLRFAFLIIRKVMKDK